MKLFQKGSLKKILSAAPVEEKVIRRCDPKEKLADALNILYKDAVNKGDDLDAMPARISEEYGAADDFVFENYAKLGESVVEYLLMYMHFKPKGKIDFVPSKEAYIDLICTHHGRGEVVSFEVNGRISRREEFQTGQQASQQEK